MKINYNGGIADVDVGENFTKDFAMIDPDMVNTEFMSTASFADDILEFNKQVQIESQNIGTDTAAYDDAFLGGAVEMLQRIDNNDLDKGFDAFEFEDEISGFPIESQDYILNARNRIEFERRKIKTVESQASRYVVDNTRFVDQPLDFLGAAFFDPALLFPAGAVGLTAKGGVSIAKTTANVGIAGIAAGGFTEIFAQTGDPLRTKGEGAVAVGASGILSGLLGNVSARLLRGKDRKLLNGLFTKDIQKAFDIESEGVADSIRGVIDEYKSGSIGAAEVEPAILEKFDIKDKNILSVLSAGLNISPTMAFMKMQNADARKLYLQFIETPFFTEGDKLGQGSEQAVERLSRLWVNKSLFTQKQRGGFFKKYRQRIKGKGEEKMSRQQFDAAVAQTLRTGDKDIFVPEVQDAVNVTRELLNEFRDDAHKLKLKGFESEEIEVLFAESYFPRAYDVDKITATDGTIDSFRRKILRPWAERKVNSFTDDIKSQSNKQIKKLQDEISKLKSEGKAFKRVQNKIDDINLRTNKELSEFEGIEFKDAVSQMVSAKYDKLTGGTIKPTYSLPQTLLGSANARTLDIHDSKLSGWLIDDIDKVIARYSRQMGVNIEMLRKFGTTDQNELIEGMRTSYTRQIEKLVDTNGDKKTIEILKKEREKSAKIMNDVVLALKGQDIEFNNTRRITNMLKQWSFMTMLGRVTFSSLPDLHRLIVTNGSIRVYGEFLNQAIRGFRGFKLNKEIDKKFLGGGLEGLDSERMKYMTDIHGDQHIGNGTAFERVVQNMSDAFSRATLIHTWNNTLKGFSSHMTQQRILNAGVDLNKGKTISSFDTEALSRMGLSTQDLTDIGRAKISEDGGSLVIDFETLPSSLKRKYTAAVRRQADIDIVTPSIGDLPTSLRSNPYVGVVLQFKTFALASHNKMLLTGVQQRDAAVASGILHAILLGMLSVKIKSDISGRDTSNITKEEWVAKGVEATGLFSIAMMGQKIAEDFIPEIPTFYDLLGEEKYRRTAGSDFLSRYALGATGSNIRNIQLSANQFSRGNIDRAISTGSKVLPFQNLWAKNIIENNFEMKKFFDTIKKSIGDSNDVFNTDK